MENMFINPFKSTQTDDLATLQARLENMRQHQLQQQLNPNQRLGGSFGKLQDFIQNTDRAKVNFANNDEGVIEKYNNMKDVFVLFMLENARPQFETWCNQRGINVVDEYVDGFIAKSNEYVEPTIKQNNEIEELKKQIAFLQQQLLNKDTI